jgi:hypothetical protein
VAGSGVTGRGRAGRGARGGGNRSIGRSVTITGFGFVILTQAVGTSSPAMSACAPDGVDEVDEFSVVPRVTDVQPRGAERHDSQNAHLLNPRPQTPKRNLRSKARAAERKIVD